MGRAHYYSCQQKVRRVHETFHKQKGDQLLCPYCIEYICPTARGSGPVVFLCGHRFHTDCANKWFLKHPERLAAAPCVRARQVSAQLNQTVSRSLLSWAACTGSTL